MDLTQLSDADLIALRNKDYGSISDAGLVALRGGQVEAPQAERSGPRMVDPDMMGRVPSDLLNVAKQTLAGIMSPVQTLKTIGGVVEGGIEAINPFMTQEEREASPSRPYFEEFTGMMADRFGTPERASQTFAQEPVGALADVSGMTTLAGGLARSPTLARAGVAIDPLNAALNVPKAGFAAMIPEGAPASMYESAAKYPATGVTRTQQAREAATETALREKIMPTEAGINKISAKLEAFDKKIDQLIQEAESTGKKIPKARIFDELPELRRDLIKGAGAPENMAAAERVVQNLVEMHKNGPDLWSPSDMQDFKTATYRDINWKVDPNAATEAMQALARGARKSLADLSPELDLINKQYAPLANLREALQRPAKRIGNLNPVGIMTPLMATAGGAMGDIGGAAAGAAAGMSMNPHILARMALTARGLKDQTLLQALTSGSPAASLTRQGALQSGRLEELMR